MLQMKKTALWAEQEKTIPNIKFDEGDRAGNLKNLNIIMSQNGHSIFFTYFRIFGFPSDSFREKVLGPYCSAGHTIVPDTTKEFMTQFYLDLINCEKCLFLNSFDVQEKLKEIATSINYEFKKEDFIKFSASEKISFLKKNFILKIHPDLNDNLSDGLVKEYIKYVSKYIKFLRDQEEKN